MWLNGVSYTEGSDRTVVVNFFTDFTLVGILHCFQFHENCYLWRCLIQGTAILYIIKRYCRQLAIMWISILFIGLSMLVTTAGCTNKICVELCLYMEKWFFGCSVKVVRHVMAFEFWGYHSGVDICDDILGCYASWTHSWVSTFWRNILQCWRFRQYVPLKEARTHLKSTWHHNPEDHTRYYLFKVMSCHTMWFSIQGFIYC